MVICILSCTQHVFVYSQHVSEANGWISITCDEHIIDPNRGTPIDGDCDVAGPAKKVIRGRYFYKHLFPGSVLGKTKKIRVGSRVLHNKLQIIIISDLVPTGRVGFRN